MSETPVSHDTSTTKLTSESRTHLMAETPISHNTSVSKVTSESRTHFTPCRQIGLKRKSLGNKNSSITPVTIKEITLKCCTPLQIDICSTNVGSIKNLSSKKRNISEINNCETPTIEYRSTKKINSVVKKDVVEFKQIEDKKINKLSLLEKFNMTDNKDDINLIENDDKLPVTCPRDEDLSEDDINKEIKVIRKRLGKKYRLMEKLKSTAMNAMKHDLNELKTLSDKWRHACQEALRELLNTYNNCGLNCNMEQVLNGLGIPHKLVKFSEDKEDFI